MLNPVFTISFSAWVLLTADGFLCQWSDEGAGEALAIDTKIHLLYTFGKQKGHYAGESLTVPGV